MAPSPSAPSLTHRTLKGAAWIGGTSTVQLGLRVISIGILARLLSPEEYGIVAGALVAMAFAAMVCTMGLAPTLIQSKEIRPDHVATAFSSSLAIAVLAGIGMFFFAPFAADLMRIPEIESVMRVLAFLVPFGAFNTLCEALLARNMKTKSLGLRTLFAFIVATFLVAIPMAYAGFGYWALVGMELAAVLVGALAFAFAARKLLVLPGFSLTAFRELWPMSLGFSVNYPFVYAVANADQFLIARILGADALGLYTRASFLTKNANNLFNTIARISLFPAMAQVQEQPERLRNAVLKSLSLMALVAMPASAFFAVFSAEIVSLLLGAQWSAAAGPFALLSLTLYFLLARRSCGALFQALGRPYWMTGFHAFNALALVAGVWFTAPHGLVAVCAAVLAVMLIVLVVLFIMTSAAISLPLRDIALIHVRPMGLAISVATLCLTLKLGLSDIPGEVVFLISTALVEGFLLILLRVKPEWVTDSHNIDTLQKLQTMLKLSVRRTKT